MNVRIAKLRVKIRSLAAEQGIIRAERHRAKASAKWHRDRDQTEVASAYSSLCDELQGHRIQDVRPEIRHALIAYGLLRGRTLDQIEPRAKRPYDQQRVDRLIQKYGSMEDRRRLLQAA